MQDVSTPTRAFQILPALLLGPVRNDDYKTERLSCFLEEMVHPGCHFSHGGGIKRLSKTKGREKEKE